MKIKGFKFYGWRLFFGKIGKGQYAVIGDVPELSEVQIKGISGIIVGTHHAKLYPKRIVKENLTVENLPGVEG